MAASPDHAGMKIEPADITVGILAGGQASRLGGIDKGWYALDGRALIEHTLDRVAPQCGQIVVSANRSLARYRALGLSVVVDDRHEYANYPGPLAGVARLLEAAATPYVLIVPVDTPRLPRDLGRCLAQAMRAETRLAVARCNARVQPLHVLMRRDVLTDLHGALADGVRGVNAWQSGLERVLVDWPDCTAFRNLNSADDARHFPATP